jgi:hypothetical protein
VRHRPRRLDLSGHNNLGLGNGALSARPLTSKDSGGLAIHDVSLACLSPGFNTTDPKLQQQLQRSMDVRDRQRQIIEARQKGQKTACDPDHVSNTADALFQPNKAPLTSRRKGPPPALSIAPPSHAQFANERVIQSAPLGASFTGLHQNPNAPATRQVINQPSNRSHTSHIHHAPAIQTNNRLPPINDVFPGELSATAQHRASYNVSPSNREPLPSPGYPPQFQAQHKLQAQQQREQQQQQVIRSREYQTAEDAVRSLTGGRDELLPRLVHYGGHQPPTPPSPAPHKAGLGLGVVSEQRPSLRQSLSGPATASRRRDRDEYERDNGSPPLGQQSRRSGPFGESPETQAQRKERFMRLMEEAWDLLHV